MTLPKGAKEIWDMRLEKKRRPNEIVFVSMLGELNLGNYQVLITARDRIETLDMRWAVDLSVCLVYDDKVPHKRVVELSRSIIRNAPNGGYVSPFDKSNGYLWMWDAGKQNGFLLSWSKGWLGIPEIGIESQPEEFMVSPMYAYDRRCFMGVKPE